MATELKCGYCGFKGNTKKDFACQTCDHEPWFQHIPYETSPNGSALDEFKAIDCAKKQ